MAACQPRRGRPAAPRRGPAASAAGPGPRRGALPEAVGPAGPHGGPGAPGEASGRPALPAPAPVSVLRRSGCSACPDRLRAVAYQGALRSLAHSVHGAFPRKQLEERLRCFL